MHAVKVLQKCLHKSLDLMDKRRVRALLGAVSALLVGRRLVLMELARHWPGALRVRAPLKRLDRLLSNRHLHRERDGLYAAMSSWLVRTKRPVILVDWSPLKADDSWQLLRAAVAVGGRSMTLYESVHTGKQLGNRKVQQAFLCKLSKLIPATCTPIVVTDAGYLTPWFRAVTELGWDYVGRCRSNVRVQLKPEGRWIPLRSLYEKANRQARRFDGVRMVETRPWDCDLVLYRRALRGRIHRGCHGKRSRRAHSRKQAKRERDPWLLATSLNMNEVTAKQVVELYSRRMQIELGFRDLKSARFGAAFRYCMTRSAERLQVLLLIHALATFVAWLAGLSLDHRSKKAYAGMNLKRMKRHYSTLRLGFEALKRYRIRSLKPLWQALMHPPPSVVKQMVLVT